MSIHRGSVVEEHHRTPVGVSGGAVPWRPRPRSEVGLVPTESVHGHVLPEALCPPCIWLAVPYALSPSAPHLVPMSCATVPGLPALASLGPHRHT